jgi:hypothetical protein
MSEAQMIQGAPLLADDKTIEPFKLAIVTRSLDNCSPRGRAILNAYFSSATIEDAAAQVGVAERTVAGHVRRFYFATGLSPEEGHAYFLAAQEAGGAPN